MISVTLKNSDVATEGRGNGGYRGADYEPPKPPEVQIFLVIKIYTFLMYIVAYRFVNTDIRMYLV